MHIVHLSFECYPVAKAGGLADVVGALPKYQQKLGLDSWVVMPRFNNDWINTRSIEIVHKGTTFMGSDLFQFEIHRVESDELGFPLYLVHVPGRLDRKGVYLDEQSGYGYWDEFERYLSFQMAALHWLKSFKTKPDILHCHDHHTALIPYLITSCPEYLTLSKIPTVLTIHNGEYHGNYDLGKSSLLPFADFGQQGYLNWGGRFNSLSAGIRKSWVITTVSESYLEEIQYSANGLESLLQSEKGKSYGIINGIDHDVWNPVTDPMIAENYTQSNVATGKKGNKQVLCEQFNLDPKLPLFAFIGRLVKEKGADILPEVIRSLIYKGYKASFLVLGTGDPWLQNQFREMPNELTGYFDSSIQYNEKLSHQIYSGADFLIMPSRVEPCGLNQMYSMRYGTIPIVRSVGGLKDSVKDIGEKDGYGIRFDNFNVPEAENAFIRAIDTYKSQKRVNSIRKKIMKLDFSWENSAQKYYQLYQKLK